MINFLQKFNIFKISERKKRIIDSNYGRKEGWYIELEGRRIGEIINPEHVAEFWHQYELILFDHSLSNAVENYEFWENPSLKYFSKSLEKYCIYFPIIVYQSELSTSERKVVSARSLAIS